MPLRSHLILICHGEDVLLLRAALWLTLSYSSSRRATSLSVPSFTKCLFHNLSWLVFLSLPLTLLRLFLPPDIPSSIDCDCATIMHPPVGQLNLSYVPGWRGQRERMYISLCLLSMQFCIPAPPPVKDTLPFSCIVQQK